MTKQWGEPENKPFPSLFDFILLQELDAQPMLEQQIATSIRNSYGIRFGAEAIDASLEKLKSQGLIENRTNLDLDIEPLTPYQLTTRGRNTLSETEKGLISTCKELNV